MECARGAVMGSLDNKWIWRGRDCHSAGLCGQRQHLPVQHLREKMRELQVTGAVAGAARRSRGGMLRVS